MKRALRRHHKRRMKTKCRKLYPYDPTAALGDYLAQCSCWCCGNPRKHFKEKTMQERRAGLDNIFEDF